MGKLQELEKTADQLFSALGDAAGLLANSEWTTFCSGPNDYDNKLTEHSAEYRQFAQHLFRDGFLSGYMLFSHDSPSLDEIDRCILEAWYGSCFNDTHCKYLGNPNSSLTTDTVPRREARKLFRQGFRQSLMLLLEVKLADPYK